MKNEYLRKINGEVTALICAAVPLFTVSHLIESIMIFKYGTFAYAVGLLIYAIHLTLKAQKEKKLLEQYNKQFEETDEEKN